MTTHLTDTQKQTIRIALATWYGIRDLKADKDGTLWGNCEHRFGKSWWTEPNRAYGQVPNYPSSLDACHEIIRHLYVGLPTLNENLKSFRDQLAKIKGCAWYQSAVLLSANAEEVSLALYLSLKLGELGD